MRFLLIGDMHVTPKDISECNALLTFIEEILEQNTTVRPIFLGDQTHNHANLHLDVLAFWTKWVSRLASFDPIFLVGNHDMPGVKSKNHALLPFQTYKNIQVIDNPSVLHGILFLPYFHDHAEFVKTCNQYKNVKLAVCHQTFLGAQYENGFYAKEGAEPSSIPQTHIISGHIHSEYRMGKVWYPGSPRWLTMSDANQIKYLRLIEVDEGYREIDKFLTSKVCTPIWHFIDTPDKPLNGPFSKGKVTVDIKGPPSWIKERKEYFVKYECNVRCFPVNERIAKVKESDGIFIAFKKYISEYQSKNNTDNNLLEQTLQERMSLGT